MSSLVAVCLSDSVRDRVGAVGERPSCADQHHTALHAGMGDVLKIVRCCAVTQAGGCDGRDRQSASAQRAGKEETRQLRWGDITGMHECSFAFLNTGVQVSGPANAAHARSGRPVRQAVPPRNIRGLGSRSPLGRSSPWGRPVFSRCPGIGIFLLIHSASFTCSRFGAGGSQFPSVQTSSSPWTVKRLEQVQDLPRRGLRWNQLASKSFADPGANGPVAKTVRKIVASVIVASQSSRRGRR